MTIQQLRAELRKVISRNAKRRKALSGARADALRAKTRSKDLANQKSKDGRVKPNVVIDVNVINQSNRSGKVSLIVLHSTESHNRPGNGDLQAIADWFNNPAAQASSHVIVDKDGNSARCVPDERKAWTCANYNSLSLNIEQIGFAAQGKDAWLQSPKELKETARWLARWSKKFDIPLELAKVEGGRVVKPGVTTHAALGALGGGHTDPGAYPMQMLLGLARRYRSYL